MNPLTNVKNVKKLSELELKRGNFKSSWHDQYKDSAWIFIGGLPYDLTEGDIICVFSQYGEIVNINLVRDKATGKSKGFSFICYEDQRSTVLAVDNLNGIKLLGRTLRVDHVSNYKPPKDSDKLDDETRQLYAKGCAPEVFPDQNQVSDPNSDVIEVPIQKVKKERKEKKVKLKKKKKKQKKVDSSSESSESDSESDSDSDSTSNEKPKRKKKLKKKSAKKSKKKSSSSDSESESSTSPNEAEMEDKKQKLQRTIERLDQALLSRKQARKSSPGSDTENKVKPRDQGGSKHSDGNDSKHKRHHKNEDDAKDCDNQDRRRDDKERRHDSDRRDREDDKERRHDSDRRDREDKERRHDSDRRDRDDKERRHDSDRRDRDDDRRHRNRMDTDRYGHRSRE